MKDLRARVGVAAVGIPAVFALLYAGGWVLAVPLAILAALGAGEVYRLSETRGGRPLSWLGMPAAAAVALVAVVRTDFAAWAPWTLGILGVVLIASLKVALVVRGAGGGPLGAVSVTLFGAAYGALAPVFALLLHALPTVMDWGAIRPSPWAGLAAVALPVAATWIGDAAAYFAGTAWGRRKLFPSVSPNKSWVGAWAELLGAAAAGALWLVLARPVLPGLPLPEGAAGLAVAAAMGTTLGMGAIVGDLVESLLKREAGLKDSGRIFPGHGGVLDRLDALAFTLPLAYAFLRVAEALR